MIKMKMILLLLSSSLLFLGCTSKTITVFEDKPVCYELEKSKIKTLSCVINKEQNDSVKIRVTREDSGVFLSRCEEARSVITFYEKQIDDFNEFCRKQENKNFPRENETGDKK